MHITSLERPRLVFSDKTDVSIRLRELQLTPEALIETVRMGQDARANSTLNDPPSATGIHGWGRTVRGLRENTQPLGYVRYSVDNIHGVINEAGTVVILVSTGDSGTGDAAAIPKTAYPKGIKVQAVVRENARQMSFFFPDDIVPIRRCAEPDPKCMYWLLVVYEGEEEVRCELSLPDRVGEDERIEAWAERIILESIPLDPMPRISSMPDMEPDLDIPLKRKA